MSFENRTENITRRPEPGTLGWLWIAIPSLLIGCLVCAQLFTFAQRFNDTGLVMVVLAIGCPVVLLIVALAARQGLAHVRSFIPTLRWWHWLWALTIVSAMVFRQRTAADIASDPLDAWAIFRIIVDMVVASVLLGRLALRRTHWVGSMFRGVVGAVSVYGLVCLASTVWSVFPPWTLFKSLEYLLDVAILAAVLTTLESVDQYRNFLNWTWALYAFLLLSVWKDVLLWPQAALYGEVVPGAPLGIRLGGVMPAASSNDVATFASILGLVCLARLFPATEEERFPKLWYTLALLVCMVSLVLSQTRAALAGFALGGFFILLFSKQGRMGAVFTLVVAPTLALCTMGGTIWSFMERGQTAAQMGTLSSRTEWWGLAWQTFLERPLTGLGAYAGGRFAVLAKAGFGGTGTMHSDYLEVLVGTGIWGLIPLFAALAGTWWLIFRFVREYAGTQEGQLAHEALAILALLTLRSAFNNMLTWHPPLPFLVILGYAEFLRRRRKANEYDPSYSRGALSPQEDSAALPVVN